MNVIKGNLDTDKKFGLRPTARMENDTMNTTTTTTKSVKLTKADKFAMLRKIPEVAENPVLVEFIDHEVELLARKNSADKKPTAQQTANKGIQEAILTFMAENPNQLFSITELIKNVPECAELTNQRVSALVRQLVPDKVERIEEKRKAFFRIAK